MLANCIIGVFAIINPLDSKFPLELTWLEAVIAVVNVFCPLNVWAPARVASPNEDVALFATTFNVCA